MLRVKFLTKIVDVTDPNHHLLTDRSADFTNFTTAMNFIRDLKKRTGREVLIGYPEIVELVG